MINGVCFTNLDEYQHIDFPVHFCAVPRLGDRVLSIDGRHSLKVVGITHCHPYEEPYVEIELNK